MWIRYLLYAIVVSCLENASAILHSKTITIRTLMQSYIQWQIELCMLYQATHHLYDLTIHKNPGVLHLRIQDRT